MTKKKDEVVEGKQKVVEEDQGTLPVANTSTEMTTQETEPFDDGMGEITQDDLIIPRLKVGQKQSPGDVAGKLFIDVTGDMVDEMQLVLLKLNKSRVLFPEDFSRDSEPLCKSQNFITPETSDKFTTMADKCSECTYGKWAKSNSGKQKPPRCQETWNFLVLDFESYMPCWFSLKSTALKPARKIISMLKLRGTAKRIPAWGFKFTVNVDARIGDSGDSYLPVFSALQELSTEDRRSMDLIHDQLAGETVEPDTPNAPTDKSDPDDF